MGHDFFQTFQYVPFITALLVTGLFNGMKSADISKEHAPFLFWAEQQIKSENETCKKSSDFHPITWFYNQD
jgi:hypothetical protein